MLNAIQVKDELFQTLEEVLGTEKRKKIFIEVCADKGQSEIAEQTGVTQPAVSQAVSKLKEFGLVEETDEGYVKTLTSLEHPLLKHLWKEEVLENE